jgi:hypothetical protein
LSTYADQDHKREIITFSLGKKAAFLWKFFLGERRHWFYWQRKISSNSRNRSCLSCNFREKC